MRFEREHGDSPVLGTVEGFGNAGTPKGHDAARHTPEVQLWPALWDLLLLHKRLQVRNAGAKVNTIFMLIIAFSY